MNQKSLVFMKLIDCVETHYWSLLWLLCKKKKKIVEIKIKFQFPWLQTAYERKTSSCLCSCWEPVIQVVILWRVDDVACIFYSITHVIFSSFFSPHAVVWAQLVGFYSDSCIPTNLDSWIVTSLWKVLCCDVWTWIALMFLFLVSIVFSKLARAVSWLVIQTAP